MGDERKRGSGRRSDIPWEAIQERFETGETNVSKLSKEFGVSRQAIIRRRDRDKWTTKQQVADTVRGKVIDIATRKAIENLGGDEKLADAVAAHIQADLLDHAEIAALAMRASKKTLQDYIDGNIAPGDKQSMADVFDKVMSGAGKGIDFSREINGLRPGQPSTQKEGEEQRVDEAVLVVREQPKSA